MFDPFTDGRNAYTAQPRILGAFTIVSYAVVQCGGIRERIRLVCAT